MRFPKPFYSRNASGNFPLLSTLPNFLVRWPMSDKHRPRNLQRHILCISPSNAPPHIARSKRKRRPPERECILADRHPEKAVLFAVGSKISSDDFALRINRKDLGFARVGEVNGLEDTFA